MAKSLLLSVLVDVLGKYVEGLNGENLKLGVFSGKIEFHNLNLKDSALDELNLPIQVKKGALKHLRVKVPWTQLESKPVEIAIDGVYLLAAPLDLSQCTPDISKKMVFALKKKKLKEVEDAFLSSLSKNKEESESSTKSASYLQQLATCIVDNLEVSLTNVHIRYEDANSDPEHTFCFGVTLDEVSLTTSDETWNAKFVKRDATKRSETAIRKIGKLNNCGIYWNSDGQSHVRMSQADWEEVMQASIYKSGTGFGLSSIINEETQFALSPPNNLTIKITHREQCTDSIPNVDMVVEISQLPFKIDKDQFRQFMLMLKSFGDLDRKRQMAQYRPSFRPKRGVSARDWWHYAFRLVTGKDHSFADKVKMMRECMRSKDNYISYIEQNLVGLSVAQVKGVPHKPLFEEEINAIEEKLPLITLIFFREEAARKASLAIQRQQSPIKGAQPATVAGTTHATEKTQEEKEEKKKGWFSGLFSKSSSSTSSSSKAAVVTKRTAEEEEDLLLMNNIQSKMQHYSEQSSAAASQVFSFRLSVTSSSTLELTYNQSSIALLQMSMQFGMEMRFSNMLLRFGLNDFVVRDNCSAQPFNRELLCMAEMKTLVSPSKKMELQKASRAQFELEFAIEKEKSLLKIRALPLVVTWNKHCVQQLLAFVVTATTDNSYVNTNEMLRHSMELFAAEAALQKADFLMEIDIDAPKVIIPDDQGFSERCAIFDAGTLHLDGKMNAAGMRWNVALQNINVAMPFTRSDALHSSCEELYLVKPFHVFVEVDNNDRTHADLTVTAWIDPDIEAQFNAQKIVRLVQVVAEVVSSIDTSKVESRTARNRAARRSSMISASPPNTAKPPETSAASALALTASTMSATPSSRAVDAQRIDVLVAVKLSRLSLRLTISEEHYTELYFAGMQCTVAQRACDIVVDFTLDSIKLTDSLRSPGFEAIILAQGNNNTNANAVQEKNALFVFCLKMFTSSKSPLYKGRHAIECDLTLRVIEFFVDDRTTLRYTVLVDQLLSAYHAYFRGFGEDAAGSVRALPPTTDAPKPTNAMSANPSSANANPLGGVCVALTIERVSLHMLNTSLRAATDSEAIRTEVAFAMHANALSFGMTLGGESGIFAASGVLRSLRVEDARRSTSSHVFRKLLSSDVYKYQDPESVDAETLSAPAADEMLRVEIAQRAASLMDITVTVGHVTVLIAVDVLLDLISVLLGNVDALLQVVNAFSMDARAKDVLYAMAAGGDAVAVPTAAALSQERLAISAAQGAAQEQQQREQQEVVVHVSVKNPQLLLIGDPTKKNSPAFANRCQVEFVFRHTVTVTGGTAGETHDNMQIHIKDSEIFVVGDLSSRDSVRRVVDPMGLLVGVVTHSEQGVLLSTKVSVSSSTFIAIRVSLNDVLLAAAVSNRLSQREFLTERSAEDEKQLSCKHDTPQLSCKHDTPQLSSSTPSPSPALQQQQQASAISVLEVKSLIPRVQIILINDRDGKNSPLLRLDAADADFSAAGPAISFMGGATITLKSDYYNVALGVWEPVIEPFWPQVALQSDAGGIEISLSLPDDVQINVTGTLLKCVANAAQLLSSASAQRDTQRRGRRNNNSPYGEEPSPLRICNQLGVDVSLCESGAPHRTLLSLVDAESHAVPRATFADDANDDVSLGSSGNSGGRALSFTLFFRGELEGKVSPLRQLSSTTSRKPRVYHLQPVPGGAASAVTRIAIAPVTVSIYQYQRYNFASQRWEAPWQMGDPYEFADIQRQGDTPPARVALPHRWQWVESDWQVDTSGAESGAVDADGWEYATDFRAFSINSPRRTKRATDLVRRRRLFRVRVYDAPGGALGGAAGAEEEMQIIRNNKIVWDVVTRPDESREIFLRTTKSVTNELPFPLEVSVGAIVFVVEPGATTCVPLKAIHEVFIRVRPAAGPGGSFSWSQQEIPVVVAQGAANNSSGSGSNTRVSCFDAQSRPALLGVVSRRCAEDSLSLTFVALVHVENRLPCALCLGYASLEGTAKSISLSPGEAQRLINMNFNASQAVDLSLRLGIYGARVERLIAPAPGAQTTRDVLLTDEQAPSNGGGGGAALRGNRLLVTLHLSTSAQGVLCATVYAKLLLVDRSSLCATGLSLGAEYSLSAPTYTTEEQWSIAGVASLSSSDYWIYGVNGMALFQPVNPRRFSLSLNRGAARLADEIDIDALGASKVKLKEIYDARERTTYFIAVQLQPYPAAPALCRVLSVMPAYTLVNAMTQSTLSIAQTNGEGEPLSLAAQSSRPWHGAGRGGGVSGADCTALFFRTSDSDWSIGSVNINDIGTSVLVLPRKRQRDRDREKESGRETERETESERDPIVLNVDVRFSHADDPSYITVTVWESRISLDPVTQRTRREGAITLSIHNDTAQNVVVRQHGVDVAQCLRRAGRRAESDVVRLFALRVPPGEWRAYGWTDLDADAKLEVSLSLPSENERDSERQRETSCVVDMKRVGERRVARLSLSPSLSTAVELAVKAGLHGNYLHIKPSLSPISRTVTAASESANAESATLTTSNAAATVSSYVAVRLQFRTLCVSLIADRPHRREFLAAYLRDVAFSLRHVSETETETESGRGRESGATSSSTSTSMSFTVGSAQIDNYAESAMHPVLLSTALEGERDRERDRETRSEREGEAEYPLPFLSFLLDLQRPRDQAVTIAKSVAFRVLETRLWVDSATILLYVSDVHADLLDGLTSTHSDALHAIGRDENDAIDAADEFTRALVKLSNSPPMDIERQYSLAQGDKVFIESLQIHPMKFVLSFTPTHYPRAATELPAAMRWMTRIETVSAVEDFSVRVKSFIARDAMESLVTLADRVLQKIAANMLSNLLGLTGNLLGSLSALGKPAGLYKKIGNGVEDFFYEPYQGLMESPLGFVKGLGKGTTQLLKGVGGGVVGSTATIVGSATGSVANVARSVVEITGDAKYARRQEDKRREMKMSHGGALAGFKAAGESVFSGLSSGLTGLVTAPLEETKKSGAMGFFVGVGKGIVGVAVKPVLGVSEGISNVAAGINQEFSAAAALARVRPARALLRADLDDDSVEFVLVPLDLYAALAQEFVRKRAAKKGYNDVFLLAVPLGFEAESLKEDSAFGVVLSKKFLFALSKSGATLWVVAVANISHVALLRVSEREYALQIVEYPQHSERERERITVRFASRRLAVAAYDKFVQYRALFGYGSLMEPSETVLAAGEKERAGEGQREGEESPLPPLSLSQSRSLSEQDSPVPSQSESAATPRTPSLSERQNGSGNGAPAIVRPISRALSLRQYAFGTANSKRFANQRMSDQQFYLVARNYFEKIHIAVPIADELCAEYHEYLDDTVWRAVSDWRYNHDTLFNPSRCCACLVINHAKCPVQIVEKELKEGVDVLIFGLGDSFDSSACVLKPCGGAALLFGFGRRPSIVSKEHVKFEIRSNAFRALVSTRENSSHLSAVQGFNAMFLEKTRTDWWAKFVIAVT